MKRVFLLLGLSLLVLSLLGTPLLSPSFSATYRCLRRGFHNPARHPLGGFVCADCRAPLVDMEEAGFDDTYVHPLRRTHDRKHGAVTRTTEWPS